MKTGVLNRTYNKAKNLYNAKKDAIKCITLLLSIVIAVVFISFVINTTNTFGGLKGWYTYREDVYDELTSILEENIVNDPYTDLKKIADTEITYTCKFYSENQSWEVRLSKGHRWVSADISYIADKIDMQVTYSSKVEYFFAVVIAHITIVLFAAFFIFALLAIAFLIIWVLFKLICLLERIIIFLKNKPTTQRKT